MEKKAQKNETNDNIINDSLTQKVKLNPKFITYLDWLKQNGAIFDLVPKMKLFYLF